MHFFDVFKGIIMKKLGLLLICVSVIFMSCSSSVPGSDNTGSDDSSGQNSGNTTTTNTKPKHLSTNTNSLVVKLLEKIPTSLEEYERYLNGANNSNTSNLIRTVGSVQTEPLSTEDEAGIIEGTKEDSAGMQFIYILKNDMKNLEIQPNVVFTVPSDFRVSDATENQFGAINNSILDWGKLEVRYSDESRKADIFWKYKMINGNSQQYEIFVHVSGIFNGNSYESVESFFNMATSQYGYEKFYTDGNSIVTSRLSLLNNGSADFVTKKLIINTSGTQEIYTLDDDYHWRDVRYKDDKGSGSYRYRIGSSTDQWPEEYTICDNNDFVALQLHYNGSENAPQYGKDIPLHFINHQGKTITKVPQSTDQNGNVLFEYYVDNDQQNPINSREFPVFENGRLCYKRYPCYSIYDDTEKKSFNFAEGFSFTEGTLRLVTNGIDKLDELRIKIDTPAVTRKILSEDSITQKQSELDLWLNSLN